MTDLKEPSMKDFHKRCKEFGTYELEEYKLRHHIANTPIPIRIWFEMVGESKAVRDAEKKRTEDIIRSINKTLNIRKIEEGIVSMHNNLCLDIVRRIRKEFLKESDKE